MIPHEKNPAKAFLSRYRALQYKCKAIERAIREAMENAAVLSVPLTVEMKTGNSWYETK